jgi:hypothetical protein
MPYSACQQASQDLFEKTTIKYASSSPYPQLFPIRPGMAQVFIDKGVAILDLPMILFVVFTGMN